MIYTCGNEEAVADTAPTKVPGVPMGRRVSNTISSIDHLIRFPTFKHTILAETRSRDSLLGRARLSSCEC